MTECGLVRGVGVLAVLAIAGCQGAEPLPPPPTPGEPLVSILTYNVNFGLAGDQDTLRGIGEAGADVAFLQETTPAWEEAIRRDLGTIYPQMGFRHSGGAGGLAVLSRFAFEDLVFLPASAGWFPAWRVRVATPIGPLQVLLVHLRPPLSESGGVVSGYFTTPEVRLEEITGFYDPEDDLVVGDFNEDEDGRALAFLEERGMRSALPRFAPEARTWRWPTSFGDVTGRYDHIVHSSRLEPVEARTFEAGRSDHLPLTSTFRRAR